MPEESTAERIAREARERVEKNEAERSAKVAAAADPVAQAKKFDEAQVKKDAAMRAANDKNTGTHEPAGSKLSAAVGQEIKGQVPGTEKMTDEQLAQVKGRKAGFDLGNEHVKAATDERPKFASDGSRSPHDKTSDGGNKQNAAHRHEEVRLAALEPVDEYPILPADPSDEDLAPPTPPVTSDEVIVDKGTQPASDRPLSPSPVGAEDRNSGRVITPTKEQAEQVATLSGKGGGQTAPDDPNKNPVTGASAMSTSSEPSRSGYIVASSKDGKEET